MTANRTALQCFLALAALLGLGANTADAQCMPGSMFCGEVQVQVGVPMPPVVYVQPAPPPVVYVQPAPPPPVVYVQPAPPPPQQVVVVQQQQPQRVYVQAAPPPVYVEPAPVEVDGRVGLHANVGFMANDHLSIGGAGVALRFRPQPYFALDIGIGGYGGTDYNQNARVEVPITADALFFFNPQSPLQLYGLIGGGVSYAHVEPSGATFSPLGDAFMQNDYVYVGAQFGLGLEYRMSPYFALNIDLRGFVRSRVDSNTAIPEFVEVDDNGHATGRTSNTSAGVYSTIGATLYF